MVAMFDCPNMGDGGLAVGALMSHIQPVPHQISNDTGKSLGRIDVRRAISRSHRTDMK